MRWPKGFLRDVPWRRAGTDRLHVGEFAWRPIRSLEALCRARAQSAYLGGDEALCRVLGYYKLFVDTRDRGLCPHLMLEGFWEMQLTRLIARRVRPGMVAIDVGANFGYFTVLLAALVGRSGRVHAIEPAPRAASLLRRSLDLNLLQLHTSVVEAAAGAANGTALLYVPHDDPKNARLVAAREGEDAEAGSFHVVPVRNLDDVASRERRVDFIKIDAEGAEDAVVAGAMGILSRDRPCLALEFNAGRLASPDRLLAQLAETYGRMQYLDASGRLRDVSAAEVADKRIAFRGERFAVDWTLVLGCR